MFPITRASIAALAVAALATASDAAPYLISAQQADFRSRPEYIRDHFAHIETLPFDGLTISTASGARLMAGVPRPAEEMARDFAPLGGLTVTRMLRNFAWVNVDRLTSAQSRRCRNPNHFLKKG